MGLFTPIPVTYAHSEFITVRPHCREQHKVQVLAANVVAEVKHNVRFTIWVGNFGDHNVTFPKKFRVSFADKPPPFVAEPNTAERSEEDAVRPKDITNPGKAPFTRAVKRRAQVHRYNERQPVTQPIQNYTTKFRFNILVHGTVLPPFDWNRTNDVDAQQHYFSKSLRDPPRSSRTTEYFWDVKTMTGVFPISNYMQMKGGVRSENSLHGHQGALVADAEAFDEHWTEQVQIDAEYLEYRDDLLALLEPLADMWDGHLGTVNITQHRIESTPDSKPSTQNVYRSALPQRQMEKETIQKMLEEGFIEPSISEWVAPIVFAPKKDSSLRLCIDYRRLNSVTIRDSYPIPRMDECIDSLGDSQVFSTLDCNSGYWKIEVAPEDPHKMAFVSYHGLYQ